MDERVQKIQQMIQYFNGVTAEDMGRQLRSEYLSARDTVHGSRQFYLDFDMLNEDERRTWNLMATKYYVWLITTMTAHIPVHKFKPVPDAPVGHD